MAVAALAVPYALQLPVRLIYNATASAPLGWYAVVPESSPRVGDLVVTHLPADIAALAAERQYLPASVPLLKPVAALAGQTVCVDLHCATVNGRTEARLLARDGRGRPLTPWPGCRQLRPGEVFLLSHDNPASFDSRYFGPIPISLVVGRAVPLWTW